MSKKQVITKRGITATLRESAFTPSTPGPLKVIIDVGNIDYYITRAIELCTLALESKSVMQKLAVLTKAISLLAVGKILIRYDNKSVVTHFENLTPRGEE